MKFALSFCSFVEYFDRRAGIVFFLQFLLLLDVHRFDNKIPPRQLKTPVESLVCVVKEKGATKIIGEL